MVHRQRIQVFKALEDLCKSAAEEFIQLAKVSIDVNGVFAVALSGGSTVVKLYENLAMPPLVDKVAWDKVYFFWGDERQVPPDHQESNFGLAQSFLLDVVGAQSANIFRIRGELPVEDAVEDYDGKLKLNADSNLDWPRFDLVLLGMGSDGHVASIFPGEISESELNSPVMTTTAYYQDRPGERVSLTPLVFNSARNIFFLVAGESKAGVLAKVFSGEGDPERLPVLRIQPEDGEVTWFLDEAAASYMPSGLQNQEAG